MHNLPKLTSIIQDSQLVSQSNKNVPEPIPQSESRKITTASQNRNLSPFTWNHIKLPTVLIKEKLQKDSKIKDKDEKKQPIPQKRPTKNQITDVNKLQTIGQKAKKALNFSVEMRKMLPNKAPPVKNLHEQVLVQYEKRKLTTGMKTRENRSFTQKSVKKMLAKTYETMEVKAQDKNDPRLMESNLLRTEQRYRNSRSMHQESEAAKEDVKRLNDRYAKNENLAKTDMPSFRVKNKESKRVSNDQQFISSLNNSIIIKSPRNSVSKNVHSHSINQQMEPYIRHYFTQKSHSASKLKIFVTTNPKYHPLHMNEHNTSAFGTADDSAHKTLIWTKLESLNVFREKAPEQFYNHVEGSHVLTSKERLHEILNGGRGAQKAFYPISFSLPKEYNDFVQEYDWVLVKVCLKFLVSEIRQFQKGILVESQPNNYAEDPGSFSVCLSDILEDLTRETKNEPQVKLLKFCLFLESGRKKEKLEQLFEKINTYRSVDINLSESIYIDIIDWCLELVRLGDSNSEQNQETRNIIANTLSLENIDYRLIQLLKAYDYLFTCYLPPYLYNTLSGSYNSWLIKPFASSKAAGISLIHGSTQFYTTPDYEYKEYRHRAKYHNKIFMKYIENPLLIKHSGMDYFVHKTIKQLKKQLQNNQPLYQQTVTQLTHRVQSFLALQQKFCARKFDIRQWVIILCDHETQNQHNHKIINNTHYEGHKIINNTHYEGRKSPKSKTTKRTKIYKYHTAYCRFAQKPYSLNTSDPEVHLTNYEMYKKGIKPDRKSPSPSKEHKYINASIVQKSEQEKGQKNEAEDREKTRKRLGSISREEKESVLMLDELFDYVDFVAQIKDKKTYPANTKNHRSASQIKQRYESQLDLILESLFEASYPHMTHHRGTFQLFGVDLLLDEDMNLYLLEVNLNPGCSADRNEKLSNQAQTMLETLFQTVMGSENQEEDLHQLKHRRIQKMQQKLFGSRQFIGDSDLQIGENQENDKNQLQQQNTAKDQENKQTKDQENKQTKDQGNKQTKDQENKQTKTQKNERKWILIGEKQTH